MWHQVLGAAGEFFDWLKTPNGVTFWAAFISALSGAGLGSWTAQRAARRSKFQDDLTKEIRNTNAALAIAFSIFNVAVILKRQHVKSMADAYRKQRDAFYNERELRRTGKKDKSEPIDISFDLRSWNSPTFPIEGLHKMIFEGIGITGRACVLAVQVGQSASDLITFMEARMRMIDEFRMIQAQGRIELLPALIFGIPTPPGVTDQRFGDLNSNVEKTCDDVIFFAKLLWSDLHKHGEELRLKYEQAKFRAATPSVEDVSFAGAQDMLPDSKPYESWSSGFASPK